MKTDQYSQYQNFLYKRALYGLKSLPTEEVEKMSKPKKIRISRVHRRAQRVLNEAKQSKSNKLLLMVYLVNGFLILSLPNLCLIILILIEKVKKHFKF